MKTIAARINNKTVLRLPVTAVLLCTCIFFAGAAQVHHPGDVSGDGAVTAEDARLCLRQAVGLESFAEESAEYRACEVDGDPDVSASDARLILRAAVGLEELPAHVFGAWTPEKDKNGLLTEKHTRVCAACGITETENCVYGEKVCVSENKTPTCTAGCEYTRTCPVCGGAKTTREEALGHSFGAWTPEKDKNGALTGKHARTCAVCGKAETGNCAYGEKVYATENRAPTCTAGCEYTETCPVCGGAKTTREEALGHSFGAWTPEDKNGVLTGKHIRVCTVCSAAETAACTYGEKAFVTENEAPTCTAGCTYTETCTVCGGIKTTEEKALGHLPVPAGDHQVCERCGKTFLFTANNEYDILRSNVFYYSGTMTEKGKQNPIEMAVFSNGFYTSASFDGMQIAIQTVGSDAYLIAPEKNAYYKTSKASLKSLGLDTDELADSADFKNMPALCEADIETEGFLDGESCTVYTFLQEKSRMLVYMRGDTLLGMDTYDTNWVRTSSLRFTEVSGTVPAHVTNPGGGMSKRVWSMISFMALFD